MSSDSNGIDTLLDAQVTSSNKSKINFFNHLNDCHVQQLSTNVFSDNWEVIKATTEENKK